MADDPLVLIDPEIRHLVIKLNDLNIITANSCAGFGPSFNFNNFNFNTQIKMKHKNTEIPYVSFCENRSWLKFLKRKKATISIAGNKYLLLEIESICGYYRIGMTDKLMSLIYCFCGVKEKSNDIKRQWIKAVEKLANEYQKVQKM
jgi:hypothetical protein